MFITGLGTAVPPRSFTQSDCWEALQRADRPEITPRTRAILQGILTHDHGIERRSLALETLDESFDLDPDTLHRRFARNAPLLASQAASRALESASLDAREIDAARRATAREEMTWRALHNLRLVDAGQLDRQVVARDEQRDRRTGRHVGQRVGHVGGRRRALIIEPHQHVARLQANPLRIRSRHHAIDTRADAARAEVGRRRHRHVVQIRKRRRVALLRAEPVDDEPMRAVEAGAVPHLPRQRVG